MRGLSFLVAACLLFAAVALHQRRTTRRPQPAREARDESIRARVLVGEPPPGRALPRCPAEADQRPLFTRFLPTKTPNAVASSFSGL